MAIYLRGVGGSPGVALGYAARYTHDYAQRQRTDGNGEAALARFAAAQQVAVKQLHALAETLRAEGRADEAEIFEAQALLAEDPHLASEVARHLREGRLALEPAINATIAQMRATLAALDDPYLRDRAPDIDAVGQSLLAALRGEPHAAGLRHRLHDLPAGAVVIADDLSPAEIVALRGGTVAGFALAQGGPTSHTLILARAFGIPAVVGLGAATLAAQEGAALVLDGDAALLIVDADTAERTVYTRRLSGAAHTRARRAALRQEPGRLADGHPLALRANIGNLDEIPLTLDHGAEGVGLFRTEFLFLERSTPPDQQEQFEVYRQALDLLGGRTLVARTLDAGGDKPLPYLQLPHEPNPALGMRGIRLSMHRPELFQTQVQALLRAAVYGDLWLMLPMITDAEDVAWARAQIRAAAELLARAGLPHRPNLPVGIMIETPAAALSAERLAREAAFFSIGSNDLAQYTLAADRASGELATRYSHTSPAVLRLIGLAAAAAARAGIPCCVCGELAATPSAAPLLAGLGVAELSMVPAAIPAIKECLREVSLLQARALAQDATAE